MKEEEFSDGMVRLLTAFEKKANIDWNNMLYDRIRGYTHGDWKEAVMMLIEDPERRTFPRIGEVIRVLRIVGGRRIQAEADNQKRREREEVDRLMNSPEGDKLRAENKETTRFIIKALSLRNVEKRKEALATLTEAMTREAARNPVRCHPDCEDGLVHTQRKRLGGRYWAVGACSRCGTKKYPSYPIVDPQTHQVLRDRVFG